jgi:hypothetical protein
MPTALYAMCVSTLPSAPSPLLLLPSFFPRRCRRCSTPMRPEPLFVLSLLTAESVFCTLQGDATGSLDSSYGVQSQSGGGGGGGAGGFGLYEYIGIGVGGLFAVLILCGLYRMCCGASAPRDAGGDHKPAGTQMSTFSNVARAPDSQSRAHHQPHAPPPAAHHHNGHAHPPSAAYAVPSPTPPVGAVSSSVAADGNASLWWSQQRAADGRIYYWHSGTGQSSWTLPAELAAVNPSAAWSVQLDSTGRQFWFNSQTGASSWTAPPGV